MTTIAQQLKAECKSAADVMERADKMRADADQDWDNETTTYTFEDGSKMVVSGPSFDVTE
jgi:hypothetical protein